MDLQSKSAYSLTRGFSHDEGFQHGLRGGAINVLTGLPPWLPLLQDKVYTQIYRRGFEIYPLNLVLADYRNSKEMGIVYFFASFARLAQYSAIWMYCNFAVQYFHAVRRLPVLRGTSYNRNIILSHNFNFAIVIWNAIYLPSVIIVFLIALSAAKGGETNIPLELSSGLIDFLHALFMLVAARLQETYLPDHSGNGNCSEAYHWGVPKNESSFFTLISMTVDHGNMTFNGAMNQCEVYESAWLVEKLMGFIALGTGSITIAYPAYRLLRLPTLFLVRYVREKRSSRYTGQDQQSVFPLTQVEPPIVEISLGKNPYPATLFEVPSIINLIASYSHYTDMKNFLSTCQASRAAINTESLRRQCCINGSKTECWGCMIQVCGACQTSRSSTTPATTVHLEDCQPYCSRCHLKRQYSFETDSWRSEYCRCKNKPEKKDQVLCRQCAALSDDKVRMMREKGEKAEMDHLLQWPLRCAKCNVYLDGKTPCWWGCGLCYSACDWDGHPSRPSKPGKRSRSLPLVSL